MLRQNARTPAANPSFREDIPSFEKVLKKTSFISLTVPSWFVKQNGEKFGQEVLLGYGGGKPQWKVKVNVYMMTQYGHVSFAAGFKEFCNIYHLEEDERLKFELVGKHRFNVTRADWASASAGELEEVGNNNV